MQLTTEQRIKRAHVQLMKHPETALYSGVLMMGDTEVVDETITAYTDGVNKRYGKAFVEALSDQELAGLVLHENLHIVFRHLIHNRDLFEENRALANAAADYVVNDVIVSLKDKSLCALPKGGLVDEQYHNMNMREVYRLLRDKCKKPSDGEGDKRKEKGDGEGQGGGGSDQPNSGDGLPQELKDYKFDEHDHKSNAAQNVEDAKKYDDRVDRALREGALLAGRLGAKIPRAIKDLLEPKVRWQDELKEFVTATMRGKDEYTWKKFNRRLLPSDLYFPSVENETMGEMVIAIDTSGSIGSEQIAEFATELVSICETVSPEKVRVLWWDTHVHGEQVFNQDGYGNLKNMLKPLGGGGTSVSCVSKHIKQHNIKAECVLVFTDGYVESDVKWDVSVPTLWLVTKNKRWTPPSGRKVVFGD